MGNKMVFLSWEAREKKIVMGRLALEIIV